MVSEWVTLDLEWTVGADFANADPLDPVRGTHKSGYSSIEGVHVNCRRRNATEREASRWLRLIFDDRAFQLYRDELETAIRCIEQYTSRRYKLNLCKYWDAMKKETVLEFRG